MPGTLRKAFLSLTVLALIASVGAGLMWWSIHTSWFANLVRARLISTIQDATGGRVDLGTFTLNPDTLNAKITKLVIHGTEPPGSPPLLSIGSVEIGLKLLSAWHRDVDVQSVIVGQPEIHLFVNPDGTTNIPTPKHRNRRAPIERLLDLKIKQLSVNQGLVQLNNRGLPFHFASQDIGLLLDYNELGPSYGVSLQTQVVNLALRDISFKAMRIAAKARLFRDHADIEGFKLVTGEAASTIELAGIIQHFAHPTVDAKLQASLSIDELAQLPHINDFLRDGRGSVAGTVHFDADSGQFTLNGKGSARGVDFVTPPFTLRNMSGDADIFANNGGMLLRHAQASARGAHFAGEGSIRNYSFLQVDCHFSDLALHEVGTYLTRQPFPWSGTAHGVAHVSARLTDAQPDFNLAAKVHIDAGNIGIPASGDVAVNYDLRTSKVEFGDSNLQLPHTSATFQGSLNSDLHLTTDSSDLTDLQPLMPILGARILFADLPSVTSGGRAHFDGVLHGLLHQPMVNGNAALSKFKFRGYDWDTLTAQLAYSVNALSVPGFQVREAGASLAGSGSAQLVNWLPGNDSPLLLHARFTNLNVVKTSAMFTRATLPVLQGIASGNISFQGTVNTPHGAGSFQIDNLDAYGEQLNRIQFDTELNGNRLRFNRGTVQSGPALISFSGAFQHAPLDWSTGNLDFSADAHGFPLASLSSVRKLFPALRARAEVHLQAAGKLGRDSFEPLRINGSADLSGVSVNGTGLGNASLRAATQGNAIDFTYSGDLRNTKFRGAAQARLAAGTPIRGDLQMDRLSFANLKAFAPNATPVFRLDGFLDGNLAFDGLLEEPARIHARATIKDLQISSVPRPGIPLASPVPDIVLRNNQPILLDIKGGRVDLTNFALDGRDTSLKLSGSVPLAVEKLGEPLDMKAAGTADLALFALFDPNVRSSGNSELAATITGTVASPNVTGAVQVRNGSFFLPDLPNGLSDVNGSVVFSNNRATIQKMSAHSGGGDISLGGSLSFGQGSPFVYHLEAAARNVRVRYANSISVTANSDLRLSGSSASGVLSGTLTVTRVVFTPNADAGNLLAAASSSASSQADQGDFLSGLHLDVGVESAPNLQVSTNLSRDVEAEIQLRLRGTPDHPIVLGSVTANQGDLKIFGTRFSLNRGEVSFVNAVRIEPILDLDLETQARGVTVDITVSGTPSKLNFNYRSDPPLQPRDIIALLTVGRAPDLGTTGNAQTGNDVGALSSGVNSVLGQAISPVSNRLSKLFGIANIKIDPYVQSITNTPQARLSVEQQISRNVTVTYVTNLSQTSEQIFRFEWALNRQFSIVALRDDNGEFGIDFQYKKRFK
jgi:translocation and assembly module TamB